MADPVEKNTEASDIFVDAPAKVDNPFGGENFVKAESTPEERGDFVEENGADDDSEDTGDNAGERDDDTRGDSDTTTGGGTEDDSDSGSEDDEASDESDSDDDESDENGESDSGSEEEQSDSEDAEDEEEGKKPPVKNKVPVSRLNKEIAKRQALEAKIRELETAVKQPAAEPEATEAKKPNVTKQDFEAMQEAMLDGETDQAFDLFAEMLAKANQAPSREEIANEVRNELHMEAEMKELQTTAVEMGTKYPELDSSNENADAGLIEEVVETRDIYVDRGLNPAEALKRAVKIVANDHGLKDRSVKSLETPPARKKKMDVDAKLKLAEKEKGKLGGDSSKKVQKLDISNLSDDQFARLSQEAKAKARGDYV